VHNGIEYGMMQAIAEGFSVLKKSGGTNGHITWSFRDNTQGNQRE